MSWMSCCTMKWHPPCCEIWAVKDSSVHFRMDLDAPVHAPDPGLLAAMHTYPAPTYSWDELSLCPWILQVFSCKNALWSFSVWCAVWWCISLFIVVISATALTWLHPEEHSWRLQQVWRTENSHWPATFHQMACFQVMDTCLVLILKDNNSRLQKQMPQSEQALDRLRAPSVLEVMMQWDNWPSNHWAAYYFCSCKWEN